MSLPELRAYDRTGATLQAVLVNATAVQWRHPLAGDGSAAGTLTFSLLAADSAAQYVVRDRIVKVSWHGAERVGFRIAGIKHALTDSGWRLDVTGVQIRCLLGDAVALPEYGLRVGVGETRRFGFMSVAGAWYVSSEWVTPTGTLLTSNPRWSQGIPSGYPDGNSYWLAAVTQPPLGGKTWYRGTFTTTATYPAVRLFVAVDDAADVYLDGELVLQIPGAANLQLTTETADVHLPVGDHVLAVEMRDEFQPSTEALRGELVCCLASIDQASADTGDAVTAIIFRSTPTSAWKVRSDNTSEPGWRRAQIVKTLFTEAGTRGVRGVTALTLGFTDTADSASVAWTDRGDYEVQTFSDPVDRIAEALFDPDIDWDVDAATMTVKAWNRRGTNRTGSTSTPAGSDPPVALRTAVDVTDLTISQAFDVVTSLYGRTAEGLVVHQTDSTAQTEAGGVVEGGMSLGSVATETTANGVMSAHLASLAYPSQEVTVSLDPSGPVAYVDYELGDTVLCPNGSGGWLAVRVLAITVDASGDVAVAIPEVAVDRTVTL